MNGRGLWLVDEGDIVVNTMPVLGLKEVNRGGSTMKRVSDGEAFEEDNEGDGEVI